MREWVTMLSNRPKFGKSYSITAGDHSGKIFIFIKKSGDHYSFLSYPDVTNHDITKNDFDKGVELGIMDYLEKVPSYVRKIAKAQFEKNRRDQMAGSTS